MGRIIKGKRSKKITALKENHNNGIKIQNPKKKNNLKSSKSGIKRTREKKRGDIKTTWHQIIVFWRPF